MTTRTQLAELVHEFTASQKTSAMGVGGRCLSFGCVPEGKRKDFNAWFHDKSRDSSVGIATGWMIGVLEFDSWWGLGIFLFTFTSRTALGPTQHPIQWVPGALSLGVKRTGCEADHSPACNAKVKE
jgi:hypothetical protein